MPKPSPKALSDFDELKKRCPDATLTELPSGAALVSLARTVPGAWSVQDITLSFIIPNGYPVAAPDCFWVDPALALNGGVQPRNSAWNNTIPETNIAAHWFSWHIKPGCWSPNRDDLLSWIRSCEERLEKIE